MPVATRTGIKRTVRKTANEQPDKGKLNMNSDQPEGLHVDDSEAGKIKKENHENDLSDDSAESGIHDKDRKIVQENKEDIQDGKPKKNKVEDNTLQSDPDSLHKTHAIYTYVLLLVVVVVAIIIQIFTFVPDSNEATIINVQSALDQLFQDFKNQPPRSARKLRNRILPYINHTRSPQPFVLLVAAMEEDQLTADCFADRMGKLISSKVPLKINGSSYSHDTGDAVKLDVDKRLRAFFQKGIFPTAAIIYNLNILPYSTLNLFYAYCDHDNPLFKEATIIFTVVLPPKYHSTLSTSDEIKKEGIVETFLQEEWSKDENFNENMIGALLSRISDTVIVLNAESKESLENSCSSE